MLLYASKYSDVNIVVNISGRFNLERGIESRLGKDFLQRIKKNGFMTLYTGYRVNLLREITFCSVYFGVYEYLKVSSNLIM